MAELEKKGTDEVKIVLGIAVIVLAVSLIFCFSLYCLELTPKLVKIYLAETDERPLWADSYVHIQSVIINVGSLTAYNCKLHVLLYQGNVLAKEAYIILGDDGVISGKNWTIIDEKVYYDGGPLARISVIPEWTKDS